MLKRCGIVKKPQEYPKSYNLKIYKGNSVRNRKHFIQVDRDKVKKIMGQVVIFIILFETGKSLSKYLSNQGIIPNLRGMVFFLKKEDVNEKERRMYRTLFGIIYINN